MKVLHDFGEKMLAIDRIVVSSNATCPIDARIQRFDSGVTTCQYFTYVEDSIGSFYLPCTEIRLVEERYADSEFITPMNDLMRRALPQPVCPPLHHISNVDNERTRNRISMDPSVVGRFDLKCAFGGVR